MILVSSGVDAALAGVLGLIVGSFLNVVIYRTPIIFFRECLSDAVGSLMSPPTGETSLWRQVFGSSTNMPPKLETAANEASKLLDELAPLSLWRPGSHCDACGYPIRWYQNIPVLSYLLLRGRCAACKARISPRYPIVEIVTGVLFALCVWRFGVTPAAALWSAFAALLVCQSLIDFDTRLLPDMLNYMLLWLGLIGAAAGWTGVPFAAAVWGAVGGYLSLWLVCQAYRLVTHKEGMGAGDFKLLAALGVWFGASYLTVIILVSAIVGAMLGGILLLRGRLAHKDVPIPFGPFLAGTGLACLIAGPAQVREWLPFAFPVSL
jgi:leader peptidase (prepilin peptidase)/N-methyltransferase